MTRPRLQLGRIIGYIGAVACWLYALCWVLLWWTPEELPPVARVFEPIVSGRSHARISALAAGGLLFAAAPFMRGERIIPRAFFALAIVALVAPGVWLWAALLVDPAATRATITGVEAIQWLALPLVAAAWVLAGTSTPLWPKLGR
jgi:hypothetical protein